MHERSILYSLQIVFKYIAPASVKFVTIFDNENNDMIYMCIYNILIKNINILTITPNTSLLFYYLSRYFNGNEQKMRHSRNFSWGDRIFGRFLAFLNSPQHMTLLNGHWIAWGSKPPIHKPRKVVLMHAWKRYQT